MSVEIPDALLDAFADRLAPRLVERLARDDAGSPWMTVEEAIAYTRIPEGTFRHMMASGEIPSHGKRNKRFHRSEVDQALLGYARASTNVTELRRAG